MIVQTVGVIGAGVMGTQIAQVVACGGFRVVLHDAKPEMVATALDRIDDHPYGLRRGVQRGKLTQEQAERARARIETTADLAAACADADLIIEAVYEDLGLKMRLFREIDRLAPARAVLTSNSAGLPIVALALSTGRPESVLGWHWFQPCSVMRLAELVVHPETAAEARDLVIETARRCGKTPQVVNDQPLQWGFVGNRIHQAARREAARIVEEGVATKEQIDAIMCDGFNWPIGPFWTRGERPYG